jgi:cell division protein FtsW (lipid II flippase)
MRLFKSAIATLALAGLAVAQSASAAPAERAASPTTQEEAAARTGVWIVLGLIAAVALAEITGAIDIFGEDDPASP